MSMIDDPTSPAFDVEASRAEALRILARAGWSRILVTGTIVGGLQPDGLTAHVKDWAKIPPGHDLYSEDTPDTPHEAAQWLVRKFSNGAPMERPKHRFRYKAPAPTTEALIAGARDAPPEDSMAQPINIQVNPVFNVSAASDQQQSDAERAAIAETSKLFDAPPTEPSNDATAVPESQAAAEPADALAGAGSGGDEAIAADAAADLEGADAGPAGGGLQVLAHDGQDGPSDSELPHAYDADFEEVGEPAAEVEGADVEAFALEDQSEAAAVAEPAPEPQSGIAYFGDDIHVARLAKMGRLLEIASEKKAELQQGWSLDEFRSLQNLIVRIDRSEASDDPQARARFLAISERSAAMSRVDAFLAQREQELEGYAKPLNRDAIAAFNPEEGWP